MALRLPNELYEDFLARYESGPVTQYDRVMHGYISVPEELLRNTNELAGWFNKSHDSISTLQPKPTKK